MAITSKNMRILPSVGRLDEIFEYHIFTGQLIRRSTNKIISRMTGDGYIMVNVDTISYMAHRVIWKMFYGEDPFLQIDHIDGNKANNIITNLRLVTAQENQQNRARSPLNTSGITGVHLHKKSNKWVASICVGGQRKHLGFFVNKEDAIAARKQAEIEFGFHPNHGRS